MAVRNNRLQTSLTKGLESNHVRNPGVDMLSDHNLLTDNMKLRLKNTTQKSTHTIEEINNIRECKK